MLKDEKLHDHIRNKLVLPSSEEKVRQSLLQHLITDLGFPKELIAVEKEIKELPHLYLSSSLFPQRRVDILCYTKSKEHLHPLLLIECKAVDFDQKAMDQALGYNHYIHAEFIALVAKDRVEFRSKEKNSLTLSYIPNYMLLLQALNIT